MVEDFNRYLKRATTFGFTTGIVLVSILFVGLSYFVWGESQSRQIQPWLEIFPQNVLTHLVDSDYVPISSKIRLIQETKLFDQFAIYNRGGDFIDGFGVPQGHLKDKALAVPINDESGNIWGWFVYEKSTSEKIVYLKLISISTILLIIVVILLIQLIFNKFVGTKIARFSDLITSIDEVTKRVKNNPEETFDEQSYVLKNTLEFKEARLLNSSIVQLINEIQNSKKKYITSLIEIENSRAMSTIATQVAHDVRSPLEALKSLEADLELLPLNSKRRIQLSITRIEEIAYNLLKSHRSKLTAKEVEKEVRSEDLLMILMSTITEKKIEFRKKEDISIEGTFDFESYGLFSKIEKSTLKNILSNLVNNSVESYENNKGLVTIGLSHINGKNLIKVQDNGKGIPLVVQKNIFQNGFTTKQLGNGLGVFNARQELEKIGGTIQFESEVGKGTVFTIELPSSLAPGIFVDSIDSSKYDKIIILDDDFSFHEVWNNRLEFLNCEVEHIYTIEDMFSKYSSLDVKTLLLIDYDLMDEVMNGIDVVVKFNHIENSILVTARGDEQKIEDKCRDIGLKLLSKNVVNYIRVNKLNPNYEKSIVLIEDDELVQLTWSAYCERKSYRFLAFNSIQHFIEKSDSIHKDTSIFIDCNLSDGIKGDVESEKIFNLGFNNLYMSTGFDRDSILKPAWIKEIFSKNPKCIDLID